MLKTYKDLVFWQRAREVSLLTVKLSKKLPNEKPVWVIVDQVLRSSFSVGANITEGYGKYKGKEYKRFLSMSLGSAQETEYWLELLRDIYPKYEDVIGKILGLNLEVIKMLTKTLRSLNSR